MPESLWPAFSKEVFSFFSAKAYVVSTQINRFNETVLLSNATKRLLNEWVKTIYNFTLNNFVSKPVKFIIISSTNLPH